MFFLSFASSLMLAYTLQVVADPLPAAPATRRAGVSDVTKMSATDVADLTPYAHFAHVAYCSPYTVNEWNCASCLELSDFEVSLAGGDGDDIQFYYVGYWPTKNTVVVAHQGTDLTSVEAIDTDANESLKRPDSKLFPGVKSDVQLHSGFADEHAKTASIILKEVKSLLSKHGAKSVTLVGHSLGGALSEIECLFMTLNLPSNIAIKGVTFGKPRVGNPAWATFFDSKVPDFQRVNNRLDFVPINPDRQLGFSHTHGEVHIVSDDDVVRCPGKCDEDDTHDECTLRSVPDMSSGDPLDHLGPYNGVLIGYC
ncbi:Alpha/Beta hydrolase protein [Suillus bovinus]|uniref:Alpha/Beta hydrolase protein n=1 Tax=Suillus bovinus TaxID=48563 RepID=UPI001B8759DC|nr:Alpha/Beta hydrolase protein [Suillus bovinus]KAG2155976.1 Alpha/Beta hydrolase protein [Suillus bovinus]